MSSNSLLCAIQFYLCEIILYECIFELNVITIAYLDTYIDMTVSDMVIIHDLGLSYWQGF